MIREPLMTVNDVARALSISRASVYRLRVDGEIVGIRVRGDLRFQPSEIDAYLERQTKLVERDS
jgi:excisionase family DNA binding protein